MGKRVVRNYHPYLMGYQNALRDRRDFIWIILNVSKLLLLERVEEIKQIDKGNVIINIDQMSRIFIIDNKKIHSFVYPFTIVSDHNGQLAIRYYGYNINLTMLSLLITSFNGLRHTNHSDLNSLSDAFLDGFEGIDSKEYDEDVLSKIYSYLLTFEIGYLRYDYDEENYGKNPVTHPLNHLDINFTSQGTYKIGLNKEVDIIKLIDVLNIQIKPAFINIE